MTRPPVPLTERVLTRLRLKQLRLVAAIAERGNILEAAREIGVSQPSATKLLQDLEADLGVVLFRRTNRGAEPNAYGAALTRHARLVLAQLGHAAQEIEDLAEGQGGRIVVGTLLAASAHLLPAAIARLRAARPKVAIEIVEGTNDRLVPRLLAGDIDMVVGRLPEFRHRAGLAQEAFHADAVRAVGGAANPLVRRARLTLGEIDRASWILPPADTTLRRQIDRAFLDRGLEPPRAVESVSLQVNRHLMLNAGMLAILPWQVVRGEVDQGVLACLPVELGIPPHPVGVSVRADARLSPAAEALLEALRDTGRAMVDAGLAEGLKRS